MAFCKESTEITGKTLSSGRIQRTRDSEATSLGPLGKFKPSCLKALGLTGFPKRYLGIRIGVLHFGGRRERGMAGKRQNAVCIEMAGRGCLCL